MNVQNKEKIEKIIKTISNFRNENLGSNIDIIHDSFKSNTKEEEQLLIEASLEFEEINESFQYITTILNEIIK